MVKSRLFRMSLLFSVMAAVMIFAGGCQKSGYPDSLKTKPGVNLLFLMNDNFGLNYILMRDALDREGYAIHHLGTKEEITPCGGLGSLQGGLYRPDEVFSPGFDITGFDALILPPGTGSYAPIKNPFGDIIDNPGIMDFLRDAFTGGVPLYAMCMGVKVPIEAGLLKGREAATTNRLKNAVITSGGTFLGADHAPVISDNLITGVRGQYYNYQNMEAVSRSMEEAGGRRGPLEVKDLAWSVERTDNLPQWSRRIWGTEASEGLRDGIILSGQEGPAAFAAAGYSFAGSGEDADGLIVLFDSTAAPLWARLIGGPGSEYLNAVSASHDSLYAAGFTSSVGEGSRDILVARFSLEGDLLWRKTLGGIAWETATDLVLSEAGPVVLGYTASESAGEEDLILVQLDWNGEVIWEKRFGGRRSEISAGLELSPRGFYLAAVSGSFNKNSDFWLIETDGEGNLLQENNIGGGGSMGHGFDWATGLFLDSRGLPVVTGYGDSRIPMGAWVIQAGEDLYPRFSRGYKSDDFYNFGWDGLDREEGLVVLGTSRDRYLDSEIFLITLDEEGREKEKRVFSSEDLDWATACLETPAGEILLLGQTSRTGSGGNSDLLIGMVR